MSFLSRGSGRHSKDEEEEDNFASPTFDEL
jgi:hypothetical protein